MGKRRQFRKQCVSVFGWLERSSTAGEFSNFQNGGRNGHKEVASMWKNKESYVDLGGVFGLSIIKYVSLQRIVARYFRYVPLKNFVSMGHFCLYRWGALSQFKIRTGVVAGPTKGCLRRWSAVARILRLYARIPPWDMEVCLFLGVLCCHLEVSAND